MSLAFNDIFAESPGPLQSAVLFNRDLQPRTRAFDVKNDQVERTRDRLTPYCHQFLLSFLAAFFLQAAIVETPIPWKLASLLNELRSKLARVTVRKTKSQPEFTPVFDGSLLFLSFLLNQLQYQVANKVNLSDRVLVEPVGAFRFLWQSIT